MPAKVDVFESHSGADTMPVVGVSALASMRGLVLLTILNEDVEALLDQQRLIEDDQAETQGQNVVAGADFEECSDGALSHGQRSYPLIDRNTPRPFAAVHAEFCHLIRNHSPILQSAPCQPRSKAARESLAGRWHEDDAGKSTAARPGLPPLAQQRFLDLESCPRDRSLLLRGCHFVC